MNDHEKILEFVAKLIDKTNGNHISWNWGDDVGDNGGYHAIHDDEYHFFFCVGNSEETPHRLQLFEIIGIPVADIVDIDSLSELYAAILTQCRQCQQDV